MKYIDADKLIVEIKRLDKENKELLKSGGSIGREFLFGIGAGYADIIKIIDSLQQEPRFPQYDNIVDKVFGAGNLEGFEYREAEMLVALAKEELLKSLQQEQPEPTCKSCGFYENNCPFIRNTFKPYPNRICKDYTYSVMKEQEQPEVDLEKDRGINMTLEKAIIHCKEKACGNTQCALEHRQLAEWLQELQQYRKNARKEE